MQNTTQYGQVISRSWLAARCDILLKHECILFVERGPKDSKRLLVSHGYNIVFGRNQENLTESVVVVLLAAPIVATLGIRSLVRRRAGIYL